MLDNIGELGYLNAVILFCALVFVHELGHYLVARYYKVTVEVFSIGFGPELLGWYDKAGTRWRISLIPLGGYVKMYGENSSIEGDAPPDSPQIDSPQKEAVNPKQEEPVFERISFATRSLGARAAIIAAGPFANFLFAIVLYALLFSLYGQAQPGTLSEQGISSVSKDSPADLAGFKPLDRIIAINGKESIHFQDLIDAVASSQGKALTMQILRPSGVASQGEETGFEAMNLSVTPANIGDDTNPTYRVGMGAPPPVYVTMPLWQAIWGGVAHTWNISMLTLNALFEIISGQGNSDDLGGPIKIVQLSNDVAQLGMAVFISFAAMLSINLGLINLFPIPALDGGHLVFILLEKLRGGRPLSERIQDYALRVGIALVLGLMIFVTIKDIVSLM